MGAPRQDRWRLARQCANESPRPVSFQERAGHHFASGSRESPTLTLEIDDEVQGETKANTFGLFEFDPVAVSRGNCQLQVLGRNSINSGLIPFQVRNDTTALKAGCG